MTEPVKSRVDAAEVLRGIVLERPRDAWREPRGLRGLLADRLVSSAETTLIVNALAEGVPDRIVRERADTPREVLLGVLTRRLVEGQGIAADRAKWVAAAWMRALEPATPVLAPDTTANVDDDFMGAGDQGAPKPPAVVRPWMIITAAVVVIAAIGASQWWGNDMAALEVRPVALDIFISETNVTDVDASVTSLSACMANAATTAEPCKVVASARPTSAFIGIDQTVTFMVQPDAERGVVEGSCEITNPTGQREAAQSTEAVLPASMFGYPQRTIARWRTTFPQPAGGWSPGRYGVSCQSALVSWGGFFVVAP